MPRKATRLSEIIQHTGTSSHTKHSRRAARKQEPGYTILVHTRVTADAMDQPRVPNRHAPPPVLHPSVLSTGLTRPGLGITARKHTGDPTNTKLPARPSMEPSSGTLSTDPPKSHRRLTPGHKKPTRSESASFLVRSTVCEAWGQLALDTHEVRHNLNATIVNTVLVHAPPGYARGRKDSHHGRCRRPG